MNIDVFISYHTASSRSIVEAIVNRLEGAGIRCWYAPRDVIGGTYASSIDRAIRACSIFLLLLNKNASNSPDVLNEVGIAFKRLSKGEAITLLPFHIADEDLNELLYSFPDAEYYLNRMHWIDAITPPIEARIEELAGKISRLLNQRPSEPGVTDARERASLRLRSNLPQARAIFDGRDELLEEIDARFRGGERVLFLEGVGGIGKSELAKQYAHRHRADFDDVLFASYGDGLKKLACDPDAIVIEGISRHPSEGDDEFFARKWRALRSVAGERTLLIVDNFDAEDDPDLDAFLNCGCKVLLTTRCRHDAGRTIPVPAIQDQAQLFRIFEEYYGAPLAEADRPPLSKLFRRIEGHTYAIELLAKQMDASLLTGEELLALFEQGRLRDGVSETVAGRAGRGSAFEHIRALFSTGGLTEAEQDVLRKLSILGARGIPARRFREWADLTSFESVNALERKGWLRRERGGEQRLSLHPMVIEVAQAMLGPDAENCVGLLEHAVNFCCGSWLRPVSENLSAAENIESLLRYFAPFDAGELLGFGDMTNFLWQVARFDEAIRYSQLLYEACVRRCGEASLDAGHAAKLVGGCYYNAGRVRESVEWYKRGLRCMRLAGGPETEELAMACEKVGRCYTWEYERDLEKAEKYLQEGLAIRKRLEAALERGETVPHFHVRENYCLRQARMYIGENYLELGRMYQTMGDFRRALECVELYERYSAFPEDNPDSAYIRFDKGVCHYHLGLEARERGDEAGFASELAEAIAQAEAAMQINSRMRGDIALDTADNRELLADLYAAVGRSAEAIGEYNVAIHALENLLGPDCARIAALKEKRAALELTQ